MAGLLGCGSKAPVEEAPAAKAAPPATKPAPQPQPPKPTPVAAPAPVRPRTPATLADAEALAAQIHAQHRISFYCGCGFTPDMRTLSRSCGYKTRADEGRARTVQWTHVVPARSFGSERACWTTEACTRDDGTRFGGIECCRAQDKDFAAIENDLFNLVPAITEVAEDRSDYPFGEVAGEPRLYGACDLEVDAAKGRVEPPNRVRGDIARIHLYMNAAWGDAVPLTAEQRAELEAWHKDDPPDAWEIERAAKIQEIQGVGHPWIEAAPPNAANGPGAETDVKESKDRAQGEGTAPRTAIATEPGVAPAEAAKSPG
jgi:deoxyribonuclease-1